MAWAFGQRVGSPMAKLVLLSLADHHNDVTGADPFPAIETIAAETEMNERSVRRHLETLETAGLIARRARGRGKFYRLSLPPKPDTPSGEAPSSPPTTPDSVSRTPDSVSATPDVVKHVSSPPIGALTDCFSSTRGGQFSALNNIRLPVSRQGQTTSPGGSLLRRPLAESSTGVDSSSGWSRCERP